VAVVASVAQLSWAPAAYADAPLGIVSVDPDTLPEALVVPGASAPPAGTAYLDVAFVWTQAASAQVSGIQSAVSKAIGYANAANKNSRVSASFRFVHGEAVTYTEQTSSLADLKRLSGETAGYFAAQRKMRDDDHADMLVLVGRWTDPYCGWGYQMDTGDYGSAHAARAFAVVNAGCLTGGSTAHELGHLLGLRHDRANASGTNDHWTYNFGYANATAGFYTVMAYPPAKCGTVVQEIPCKNIPYWSSPDVLYRETPSSPPYAVGTSTENNAKALNESRLIGEDWRIPSPVGAVQSVTRAPGGIRIKGYALDYDAGSGPISIRVSVDGSSTTHTADDANTTSGSQFPAFGNYHGFNIFRSVASGSRTVCVTGVNTGPGADAAIDPCATYTIDGDPVGDVLAIRRAPGGARVTGWALDPDTSSAINVQIKVDGVVVATVAANDASSSIPTTWSEWGTAHGFTQIVPVTSGATSTVCATAVNVSGGTSQSIGCSSFFAEPDPFGALDSVALYPSGYGGVIVKGWSIDPDTAASNTVQIRVNGTTKTTVTANQTRSDIGASYPDYGSAHGFSATLSGLPTYQALSICAYGVNAAGAGVTSLLGCRNYTIDPSVRGAFTITRVNPSAGQYAIRVTGWILNPGNTSSLTTDVIRTTNGNALLREEKSLTADDYSSASLSAFPYHGAYHGFTIDMSVPPPVAGVTQEICVSGYDVYFGSYDSIGCQYIQ
jgi:hypothetical protein